MGDTNAEAYDRGHLAGRIDQRLEEHDRHFAKLNGSTAELVVEVRGLRLDVQRLADQAVADATTRVATAAALKDAVDVRRDADGDRRDADVERWTPTARRVTVLLAVLAVGSMALNLFNLLS